LRNKTVKGSLALLTVLGLVLGSTYFFKQKDAPFGTLKEYQAQKIAWSTCNSTFKCGVIKVPIDYSNVKLGNFKIAMMKYQAIDQAHKLGSLVVNPGGPGGSGIEYVNSVDYIVSSDILTRYDIVGFDPRGIGASTSIHCLTDKETDASYAADSKPDNARELQTILTNSRKYIANCQTHTQDIMHFGSAEVARDMDLIRAALGDKKLNYLGKSYGTYLGTLYAQFFPNHVGRMILDGAINPNITGAEQNLTQAIGFDHALNAFVADCFTQKDCPLLKPQSKAIAQIIATFHNAATKPLTSKQNRPVTESLVVLGTATALYDSSTGWPQLRVAFKESLKGGGSTFLELADEYTQRNTNGTYGSNEADSAVVIDCLDWPDARTVAQIQASANNFSLKAPVFGPYLAYSALSCQYFPHVSARTVHIATITTTPTLIIGTTRDPATPYEWALGLHGIIQNSRLISLNADGHTGQGRGSTCVDSAVDRYLLTGVLPAADLACSL
jgi:pimeloyl-ACP methyl ester carboxylesterase